MIFYASEQIVMISLFFATLQNTDNYLAKSIQKFAK